MTPAAEDILAAVAAIAANERAFHREDKIWTDLKNAAEIQARRVDVFRKQWRDAQDVLSKMIAQSAEAQGLI